MVAPAGDLLPRVSGPDRGPNLKKHVEGLGCGDSNYDTVIAVAFEQFHGMPKHGSSECHDR